MSHDYETVAYVAFGAIYCPDCWQGCDDPRCNEGCDIDLNGSDAHCVIRKDIRDGDTCGGACGCCWVGGEWETHADAVAHRWSRCYSCNAQRPWTDLDAETRLAALRGKLECDCCGQSAVHF